MLHALPLALPVCLHPSAGVSTPLADLYVDANAVDCAAGTGSPATPFCTIEAALTVAVDGDRVLIAPGIYRENLDVVDSVEIIGLEGRDVTIVDGGGSGSVISVGQGVVVTIDGLTVRNGLAPDGGGILSAGALTLRNSTVSGNEASGTYSNPDSYGGGIGLLGGGPAVITNCTIAGNAAVGFGPIGGMPQYGYGYGGGIAAVGVSSVLISGSTIRANSASYYDYSYAGGALLLDSPTVITDSAIIGNTGNDFFGAVTAGGGAPFELRNSTISGNVGQCGLKTFGDQGQPTTIDGVTITGNGGNLSYAGWAHYTSTSDNATLRNSVIAGNYGLDLGGSFASQGHNFIGQTWATSGFVGTDQVGTYGAPLDPLLGPLASNGGPTLTHAPQAGSPLIDAADPAIYTPIDQRGFTRVGVPDIGAHEFGSTGGAGVSGCTSAPNSTGAVGALSAAGSASVSANAMTLAASSLPAGVLGIFVTSRTPGFTVNPGGSAGNLCLAGAIGRLVGPGQVLNSGPGGAMALAIDLQRQPAGGTFVPVLPGDTWYFQAWHRDAGAAGPTSNFTAGTVVVFTP